MPGSDTRAWSSAAGTAGFSREAGPALAPWVKLNVSVFDMG